MQLRRWRSTISLQAETGSGLGSVRLTAIFCCSSYRRGCNVGLGLGLAHFVPLIAYLGFWIAILISLGGRPLWGLYYMLPFLPYRTLRDHFLDYPLGANVTTILVLAIVIGALI